MKNKSETGHGLNAANFESLGTQVIDAGARYNPSRAELKPGAITALVAQVINVLLNVSDAETNYKRVRNERQLLFKPFKKLVTRIMNMLFICGVSEQQMDDAMFLQRKIQGRRAKPRTRPTPEEIAAGVPKMRSVSQLSYDSLLDHFNSLLIMLKAEPLYKPNEDELKVTTLQALFAGMDAKNKETYNVEAHLARMRDQRQTLFYSRPNGMYHIALAVKTYVRSAFTPESIEYKQLSALKFTNLSKRS